RPIGEEPRYACAICTVEHRDRLQLRRRREVSAERSAHPARRSAAIPVDRPLPRLLAPLRRRHVLGEAVGKGKREKAKGKRQKGKGKAPAVRSGPARTGGNCSDRNGERARVPFSVLCQSARGATRPVSMHETGPSLLN